MPNVAPGKRSSTAWASTWAVEWRIVNSPSALSPVTIATSSPSASGVARSRSSPFTTAITAALARRDPMSRARSAAVVPEANARVEPSGNRIVISSDMEPDGTGAP